MHEERSRRAALTWLLIGMLALALLAAGSLYRPFESQAGPPAAEEQDEEPALVPPPLPGKRMTILVLGVDKRDQDRGRSDMMMVISYDQTTQQAAILSIPRDTWVQIPGRGYDKINHSYAFGGARLAVRTVQRALSIPIDHYATLSFAGFQQMVDAMGGVEIDVQRRMFYHDPDDLAMGPDGLVIDFQPGLQPMSGLDLLKYTRFRSDDEGDLGRIRRQHEAVMALMKVAAKPAVLAKAPQLIPSVYEAIETDLTVAQMVKLATSAREVLASPLTTGTLVGEPAMIAGVYYLVPDLLQFRTTAYEILVGAAPPDSFLARARADQVAYEKALAEAREASRLVSQASPATPGAASGRPEQPAQASPEPAANPDPPDHPSQPAELKPAAPAGEQPKQAVAPGQPLPIAVVDASGQKLGVQYAQALGEAGYRVARVSEAGQVIPRTVVIDRLLLPGSADQIRLLLPGAIVVQAADINSPVALEVILGSDLPTRLSR